MERHLRLVVSNNTRIYEKNSFYKKLEKFINKLENIFTSKTEKILVLKEILINIYRDYEITTGIIDEPYFLKAEKKISRIIRENKVDYYYNLLRKFR